MSQNIPLCVVSCSVLKRELQQLKAQGTLDAELVFVSKNFHIDYTILENNLRKVLEHTKKKIQRKNRTRLWRPLSGPRQRNEKAC